MSPWLQSVMMVCMAALLVTGGMCLHRLVIGPRAGDRAIAFDTLSTVFIGIVCLACLFQQVTYYFDAVWILTLVGYIGSAAIAKYIERGRVF